MCGSDHVGLLYQRRLENNNNNVFSKFLKGGTSITTVVEGNAAVSLVKTIEFLRKVLLKMGLIATTN